VRCRRSRMSCTSTLAGASAAATIPGRRGKQTAVAMLLLCSRQGGLALR
jgi:hypothetical protein